MRGESTHIWQGAQMSFHLRRTLKGDRHHPSCQEVVLTVGKRARGEADAKSVQHQERKKEPAVLTGRAPNDLIMIRNKCHSGEPDDQMPLYN